MVGRRRGARSAFTLLELLVVVGIILVLASLSFVVISAVIRKARIAQTGVEIKNLQGAIERYRHALGAFPPDTGGWNEAVTDPRSIHRYLGQKLTDPTTGKPLERFFSMKIERYEPLDAEGLGVLKDPWGKPYHLDAIHMQTVGGEPKRTGEPYLPSRPEIEKTKDYKIMSVGPDGESADYPFDQDAPDPRTEDDIGSW
ncbi:MAG: prepilin-type N-terminal cleavage/methylation domain-containing protein [Planctomycetota bacterium]|jgi:prepilin-type N-terminal cleavage/methylation domain-containing protein